LHDLVDEQAATDGTAQVVEDDRPEEGQGTESIEESVIGSDEEEAPVPEKSWKKDDLIDWAEAHDVDLGDASTKDDIWEIIDAYLEN
jgi:hypothetical protein